MGDYRKWIADILADRKMYVLGETRKLTRKEKRETLHTISLQVGAAPWNQFAKAEAREIAREAYALSVEFQ